MEAESESRFTSLIRNLFSKQEPLEEHILDAQEDGEIEREDVSMLLNVLSLEDKHVSEIMIPRTDMVCADVDTPARELAEVIIKHGHTRIPIYTETRDTIIGILHAKDLLRPLLDGTLESTSIESIVRPPYFVKEDADIKSVLGHFQNGKMHMAIVQDKYGGTAGIVTLEDIIEEIVGEIRDEHDEQEIDEIESLQDGAFLVSGRISIEMINETLGLSLDSETVESMGGYIAQMAGRIPTTGEYFNIEGYRFTVQESDKRRIDRILVQSLEKLN